MSLVELLKQFGVKRAGYARSGTEGIHALSAAEMRGEPYDVLLLDYHMPSMNGIEVAKLLQQKLQAKDLNSSYNILLE